MTESAQVENNRQYIVANERDKCSAKYRQM